MKSYVSFSSDEIFQKNLVFFVKNNYFLYCEKDFFFLFSKMLLLYISDKTKNMQLVIMFSKIKYILKLSN